MTSRVTDRQTDRQTDGNGYIRPAEGQDGSNKYIALFIFLGVGHRCIFFTGHHRFLSIFSTYLAIKASFW